jgi:FO synthase subunit 2
MSQLLLQAGVNDFGGTLINESISTSAGSEFGQIMKPKEIRSLIMTAGRVPAQRNSVYEIIKVFDGKDDDHESLLDMAETSQFGSYHELIKLDKFRYSHTK